MKDEIPSEKVIGKFSTISKYLNRTNKVVMIKKL